MEPSREKDPKQYPPRRLENIAKAKEEFEKILDDQNVKSLAVLPVSAYIEWNQEPTTLEPDEWEKLRIEFDGRYNINGLIDLLEDNDLPRDFRTAAKLRGWLPGGSHEEESVHGRPDGQGSERGGFVTGLGSRQETWGQRADNLQLA
jgi:hypothetical protein